MLFVINKVELLVSVVVMLGVVEFPNDVTINVVDVVVDEFSLEVVIIGVFVLNVVSLLLAVVFVNITDIIVVFETGVNEIGAVVDADDDVNEIFSAVVYAVLVLFKANGVLVEVEL